MKKTRKLVFYNPGKLGLTGSRSVPTHRFSSSVRSTSPARTCGGSNRNSTGLVGASPGACPTRSRARSGVDRGRYCTTGPAWRWTAPDSTPTAYWSTTERSGRGRYRHRSLDCWLKLALAGEKVTNNLV